MLKRYPETNKSASYGKEVEENRDGWVERKKKERKEKNECPYRVGMQHSKEVGAGEEPGAGRLKQQAEARPGARLSDAVVSTQLCNAMSEKVCESKFEDMLHRLHIPECTAVRGLPGMDGCISVSSAGSSLGGCSSGLLSLVIVLRIL